MNCGTFQVNKSLACLEAAASVKEIDRIIAGLKTRRKQHTDFLAANDQLSLLVPDALKGKVDEYSKEFEELWAMYPARGGVKPEKKAAFARFKKIPLASYPLLKQAVQHYKESDECQRATRDMMRFLKEDYWPQWIKKTEAMSVNQKDKKHERKEKSQTVAEIVEARKRAG